MIFIIEYDKQPHLFLKKAEKHVANRIIDKLEQLLSENPVPHDAKPVVGHHGVFRIRIGKYHVLYRVNYHEQKIVVIAIDKLAKVYD